MSYDRAIESQDTRLEHIDRAAYRADGEWGVIWLGTERIRNGKEHDLPLVR
jgi:hypothetical protein